MTTPYIIEPLDASLHDRAAFSCGESSLDAYIGTMARKDVERGLATCYVMVAREDREKQQKLPIIGYYTLGTCSVAFVDLPSAIAKTAGKYAYVPGVLIGRLAVSKQYHRQGIGDTLLFNALRRIWSIHHEVGVKLVVVDALHEQAAAFYERYPFIRIERESLRLLLPIETLKSMLRKNQIPEDNESS